MRTNKRRRRIAQEDEEDEEVMILENLKQKEVIIDRNYNLYLEGVVYLAEGVTDPPTSTGPYVTARDYSVVFWVRPDDQYRTREIPRSLELVWDQKFSIALDGNCDNRFLYVEVIRSTWIPADPGTSTGDVVVGRARIRLPKQLTEEEKGLYSLERWEGAECKARGYISVSMRFCRKRPRRHFN